MKELERYGWKRDGAGHWRHKEFGVIRRMPLGWVWHRPDGTRVELFGHGQRWLRGLSSMGPDELLAMAQAAEEVDRVA